MTSIPLKNSEIKLSPNRKVRTFGSLKGDLAKHYTSYKRSFKPSKTKRRRERHIF